jgi:hypothetical protein
MCVADVIRAADELGATYPDILQMLADATKQKNVETPVASDRLPKAGRAYYRPADLKSKGGKVKIGRPTFSPNMFPEGDNPEDAARAREDALREAADGKSSGSMMSVPSETAPADNAPDSGSNQDNKGASKKSGDKSKSGWLWFNRK